MFPFVSFRVQEFQSDIGPPTCRFSEGNASSPPSLRLIPRFSGDLCPSREGPPAAGSIGFRRKILQRWNHPEADEAFMRPHTCGCSSGRNQMGDSWERGHGASAGMFSFGSLFTYFINSTYILMHSFLLRRRTRITRQSKQWSAGGLFFAVLTVK